MFKYKKKPEWLRVNRVIYNKDSIYLDNFLKKFDIITVCDKAHCPNKSYCLENKELTFLIMGSHCTRNCSFCNIKPTISYDKLNIDLNEPEKIAYIVNKLKIEYVVITSVTRDDLQDGGLTHYYNCIKKIKMYNKVSIEILCPDFKDKNIDISLLLNSGLDVFAHNLETVPALYSKIRPEANYDYSLYLLNNVKKLNSNIITKTGIMLGLGETVPQVENLIDNVASANCDIFTIGQYLPPSKNHFPLFEYISPKLFKYFKDYADKKGIKYCLSSPLVRSSYKAKEVFLNYHEQLA